jgi:hypothetical protein
MLSLSFCLVYQLVVRLIGVSSLMLNMLLGVCLFKRIED